jgi:DegV family protein with EDD domain
MAEYKITCGSTCDLTADHLRGLDIGYAKYHYIIDGVDHLDDLFEGRTPEDFYGEIDRGALPTTSQVTAGELIDLIEPILAAGYDVLHIEFSSGLSGGWQSAVAAKAELDKKYPERKLLIVDSLAASSGYGLLVDRAAELKRGGMGIDELYSWLESNKLKLRHWFFTTNLAHLKRGGRVSGPAAAIGGMLNICPVMDVNSQGKLIVRKKVMGKKKAIKELYNLMCTQAVDGEGYSGKCFISNSRCVADAKELAALVDSGFANLNGKVEIDNIGPVIGSHTGPGTIALFFFGKEDRTL